MEWTCRESNPVPYPVFKTGWLHLSGPKQTASSGALSNPGQGCSFGASCPLGVMPLGDLVGIHPLQAGNPFPLTHPCLKAAGRESNPADQGRSGVPYPQPPAAASQQTKQPLLTIGVMVFCKSASAF